MVSYKETFIDTILDLSESNDWSSAKLEWDHIHSADIPGSNCICGKSITNVCTIKNIHNNRTLEVGNVCVNKFLEIDRESDFQLLKHNVIRPDLLKELLHEKVIDRWEYDFYTEHKRKRKYQKINEINKRIILKAKQYIKINKMKKRDTSKTRLDSHAFINIKDNMNLKQEHREMLGKFIATQGYKIMKGSEPISFDDVFKTLKETLIQTKKLRDSYENIN